MSLTICSLHVLIHAGKAQRRCGFGSSLGRPSLVGSSATVVRWVTGVDTPRVKAYRHIVVDRAQPGCGRDLTSGIVGFTCVSGIFPVYALSHLRRHQGKAIAHLRNTLIILLIYSSLSVIYAAPVQSRTISHRSCSGIAKQKKNFSNSETNMKQCR